MKWPEELIFIPNGRIPPRESDARLDGKLCLITGATSGVGLSAARRLAQAGADLVLICRNLIKAADIRAELVKAHGAQVDIVAADFTRLADVRRAAADILERYPRIDVLINNAGIHNTHRHLTEDGFEEVFAVNHLASFLFTRLLLDRIVSGAPARILQVNSQGHRFGGLDLGDLDWARRRYRGLQGYGASKIAQLLTVWELADRLQGSGVTINAMHPGGVRTNIGMNNELLFQWYQKLLIWPSLKDPAISGKAIHYLVADPAMANVNGRFFNLTTDELPATHARDRAMGKRVWQISEVMTGLAGEG